MTLYKVEHERPRFRQMMNPFTGESNNYQCPSRRCGQPEALGLASDLRERELEDSEFDVSLSGVGIPVLPPLEIGLADNQGWKRFEEPYHLEVRCRVREKTVRLFSLDDESDLHRPPDIANWKPKFDEDCSSTLRDGLFQHPELGAITIPNAGCAKFWMEFNYGNFIYPQAKDGRIDWLEQSIVKLATESFGVDFVQACDWG